MRGDQRLMFGGAVHDSRSLLGSMDLFGRAPVREVRHRSTRALDRPWRNRLCRARWSAARRRARSCDAVARAQRFRVDRWRRTRAYLVDTKWILYAVRPPAASLGGT